MELFIQLLPILFYCLSGALDAFMDTIKDHYTISIFQNMNQQFWNPTFSWRNKYINGDPKQGHKKLSLGLFSINFPDALTDAWHIGKALREGCIIIALTIALLITFSYGAPYVALYIIGLSVLRNQSFNLFYNHLLIK